MPLSRLRRAGAAALASLALVLAPALGAAPAVAAARTDADALAAYRDGTIETVSADALPAPQVNGVVWDQEVVGSTVYAVGEFTAARPAGSPAGQDEVPRTNALAYDITTGELLDWAPTFDAAVKSLVASPDGTRLYAGGLFSSVNSTPAYRVAALTTSGELVDIGLGTNSDVEVLALSEDGTLLYAGGAFTDANNTTRTRVLEYDLAARKLTDFAPVITSGYVRAIATEPGGTGVAIGGNFSSVNGSSRPGEGMAVLEARTGTLRANALSEVIHGSGTLSAIMSLKTDSRGLYGAAFSQKGTLEGVFRASWTTGELDWMLDCHGDSYDVFPHGDVVYISSHEHDCENVGDYQNDWGAHHHGTAAVNSAVGTVKKNVLDPNKYTNFAGQPSTRLATFFPDFTGGTYTGMNQATWTVEGNEDYVVYGGEFLSVNGTAQQGLVRFARRSLAPNQEGPTNKGAAFTFLTATPAAGLVCVTWTANWDRDDKTLTYELYRDSFDSEPVWSGQADSTFWDRPVLTASDLVEPGSTHTYALKVSDKWGASTTSDWTTVTATTAQDASPEYLAQITSFGVNNHWHMDERTGAVLNDDTAGIWMDVVGSAYKRALASPMGSGYALGLTASRWSTSYAVESLPFQAPDTFSVEVWLRTTTTTGGHVIGMGTGRSATSQTADRLVYMRNDGTIGYVLRPSTGVTWTLESTQALNDGQWHHVVATTSTVSGSVLYVDGTAVDSDRQMQKSAFYGGYWRIGMQSLAGLPKAPTSNGFVGELDEAATYNTALTADQVRANNALVQRENLLNNAPVPVLSAQASYLSASVDATASRDVDGTVASWTISWGDGTPAEDLANGAGSHTYAAAGTYTLTLTVTDEDGATATTQRTLTVQEPPNAAPVAKLVVSATSTTVTADGSGSADEDGTVVSYRWDWGDGKVEETASASQRHRYTSSTAHTVTLVVIDDDGAVSEPATLVVRPVNVGTLAVNDDFTRTVVSGWGRERGSLAWSVASGGTSLSVKDGDGLISLAKGASYAATQTASVGGVETDSAVDVALGALPVGDTTTLVYHGRATDAGSYALSAVVDPAGKVMVSALRIEGKTRTVMGSYELAGGLRAGQVLHLRLRLSGGAVTTLRARAWTGEVEPSTWDQVLRSSQASLATAGRVRVDASTGPGSTTPVLWKVGKVLVRRY